MSVRPKPFALDPDFPLPKRRAAIFETDQRGTNTVLVCALILVSFVALIAIIGWHGADTRPVAVIQEDAGFVMYRTTEAYRLRKDIVRTFLECTLQKLLTINPGYYDYASLRTLVGNAVLTKFSELAKQGGSERLRTNQRQTFTIFDCKRTMDPNYPDYIAVLVRGEFAITEEKTDSAGNTILVPKDEIRLYQCYLKQQRPSPENPFGLVLIGLGPKKTEEAEGLWQRGVEFEGTKDTFGNPILGIRPKPSD